MSLLLFLIFLGMLIPLCWFDLRYRILPDLLNYALLWSGLMLNPLLRFVSLYSAVVGVIIGYGLLWVIYYGFKSLTQKEGVGFGDFKLLAALGAWFGWQAIAALLFIATSVTLSVLLLLKLISKYPKDKRIPLGPGLCFAGVILYLTKLLTLF